MDFERNERDQNPTLNGESLTIELNDGRSLQLSPDKRKALNVYTTAIRAESENLLANGDQETTRSLAQVALGQSDGNAVLNQNENQTALVGQFNGIYAVRDGDGRVRREKIDFTEFIQKQTTATVKGVFTDFYRQNVAPSVNSFSPNALNPTTPELNGVGDGVQIDFNKDFNGKKSSEITAEDLFRVMFARLAERENLPSELRAAYLEKAQGWTLKEHEKPEQFTAYVNSVIANGTGAATISLHPHMLVQLNEVRYGDLINKNTVLISDPVLRASVQKDLLLIAAGGDDAERIAAMNRLMYDTKGNAADLKLIGAVIKLVAEQPGNRTNPLTTLAAAKVRLDEVQSRLNLPNPGDDAAARELSDVQFEFLKAAKLASGVDPLTGKIDLTKVNRVEAAAVNRQAAVLLRASGDNVEADQREMIARFFEVGDSERNRASIIIFNNRISRWKDNPLMPSIRAKTDAETNLSYAQADAETQPRTEFKLGENKQKYDWKVPNVFGEKTVLRAVIDKDGKVTLAETPLEREKWNGSLRPEGIIYQKIDAPLTMKNGKIVRDFDQRGLFRNSSAVPRTFEAAQLNQNGINRGIGLSRGVDLIGIFNKQFPFYADLYNGTTEKRIALRDRLEREVVEQTTYVAPPKPDQLPKLREDLLKAYGTGEAGKREVDKIMKQIEEASRVFWNK